MSSSYVFGSTQHQAELERLRAIEVLFDPASRRVLNGAGVAANWRCLEIGAGAGSIVRWLSEAVGPRGGVTAVDLDCRFLRDLSCANVQIVEGDFNQISLPPKSFDLVHARYVLVHMAEPQAVIRRMLNMLKPGGWIVVEEPDFSAARVATGPDDLVPAFQKVRDAIHAMFDAKGTDWSIGFKLPRLVRSAGCGDLYAEQEAPLSPGGAGIASMMKQSAAQLREKYLETGQVTARDVDAYAQLADDPSSWAVYYATVRVKARKPNGAHAT
jgi:SAM-dependent methyltransferase